MTQKFLCLVNDRIAQSTGLPAVCLLQHMIYTYTFEAGPKIMRWLIESVVKKIFDRQTRRRFTRLKNFLAGSGEEIERWQHDMRDEKISEGTNCVSGLAGK